MSDARDWTVEYDGAAPPLPKEIMLPWQHAELLPQGAYLISIDPRITRTKLDHKIFAGILRVRHRIDPEAETPPAEARSRRRAKTRAKTADEQTMVQPQPTALISASGDLYSRSRTGIDKLKGDFTRKTDTGERLRLLQFPLKKYRYYLRLETLDVKGDDDLILGFDTHAWAGEARGWERRQPLSLRLKDLPPPELKPPPPGLTLSRSAAPTHPALNSLDTNIADIELFRIEDAVRHATVCVHDLAELGLASKDDLWKDLWNPDKWFHLRDAGWLTELKLAGSSAKKTAFAEPEDGEWRRYKLNRYHDVHDLDGSRRSSKWDYHFLVVKKILLGKEKPEGIMYDVGDNEAGDRPRQGAALAAEAELRSGKMLKESPRQFNRTAMHEMGHMQGLYHNTSDPGLMQPGEFRSGQLTKEYLKHAEIDKNRLWHLPDHWVRPGGVPFGYRYRANAVDVLELVEESEKLKLQLAVEPHSITAGCKPEALVLELHNTSEDHILCPNNRHAQLRYGRLGITLTTPAGDREVLRPVRYPRELGGLGNTCLHEYEAIVFRVPWKKLKALNQAGLYEIEAHLLWTVKQQIYRVSASQKLYVS